MITHGTQVTLNERGIQYHMSSGGAPKRSHRYEWRDRLGTVKTVSVCKKYVAIMWHGNKSLSDNIPIIFLQLA